jgi:hypothetical protein
VAPEDGFAETLFPELVRPVCVREIGMWVRARRRKKGPKTSFRRDVKRGLQFVEIFFRRGKMQKQKTTTFLTTIAMWMLAS